MNTESKIESILFYKNEPMQIAKLASILEISQEEVVEALVKLKKNLTNRGVCLMENGEEVVLATSPEASLFLEKITRDEMHREIGRAGLETLSIILYNGGAGRREVDYIRGVNSSFILRNLMIRGLLEKEENPKNKRQIIYKPSINLLAYLGIKNLNDLPEFQNLKSKIVEAGQITEEVE